MAAHRTRRFCRGGMLRAGEGRSGESSLWRELVVSMSASGAASCSSSLGPSKEETSRGVGTPSPP